MSLIDQLEEKIVEDLKAGAVYEALQYVQSFIARKKKTLGSNVASKLVFHGARRLIDYDASSYAGTLLLWFLDGGAGEENRFHVEIGEAIDDETNYCDVQRFSKLATESPSEKAALVIDAVYKPLMQHIESLGISSSAGAIGERLRNLEDVCGSLLEVAKNWRTAFKSRSKTGDMAKVAKVLDLWSQDAYTSERPLFFIKAIFDLYAKGDIEQAVALVGCSHDYIVDEGNNPSIAAWHLVQMITELYELPSTSRGNKVEIFNALSSKYTDILANLDQKLPQYLPVIGTRVFGCPAPVSSGGLDPFAMLQALSGVQSKAAAGGKGGAGGLDMGSMMKMMQGMQGQGKAK